MARASKLTPEREAAICEALRHGATWTAAAAAAGIGESTIHAWRERGEAETAGRYREFVEAATRAVAEGERAAVRAVFASFTESSIERRTETMADGTTRTVEVERPPDPMMAIRWLERRVPGAWSPRHILEHAVPVEPAGPREVRITLVSPDGSKTTATRGGAAQPASE